MASKTPPNVNIPLDLMLEILKRLPAKPLLRFRCVSKEWESIIRGFITVKDSIVTRSLTPPWRVPHFIIFHKFSSSSSRPSPVYSYTYANEETFGTFQNEEKTEIQYVRGLIGFWSLNNSQFTIHNPTTSQTISLPNVPLPAVQIYLFGYDPSENQYKVLCASSYRLSWNVYTLGDPKKQYWRNIQCNIDKHFPQQPAVCINGKIYYECFTGEGGKLATFDVRSEKFNYLKAPTILKPQYSNLVNYQGKLGRVCWEKFNKDVDLWVMEDAKKQEWSKITLVSMLQDLSSQMIRFSAVTHPGGEFVIVRYAYTNESPLEIYYYDPKQKSRRSFEIKTTMPTYFVRIMVVTDHVENTMWL